LTARLVHLRKPLETKGLVRERDRQLPRRSIRLVQSPRLDTPQHRLRETVHLLNDPRLLQDGARMRKRVDELVRIVELPFGALLLRSQPFGTLLCLHPLETASLELLAAPARTRLVAPYLRHPTRLLPDPRPRRSGRQIVQVCPLLGDRRQCRAQTSR